MNINQQVRITVAEPWDFKSLEGDNVFTGVVCEYVETNLGNAYLIKTNKPFLIGAKYVNYVVATFRNKIVDDKNINIAYIPNELKLHFKQYELIKSELKFIIIGTLN